MPYFLDCDVRYNEYVLICRSDARKCPTCEELTHRWEDLGDLTTRIKYDWYVTHDGFHIVSKKVKSILEDACVPCIAFVKLSNGSFAIRVEKTVCLDLTNSLQRTKGPCAMCGRLTAILGNPYEAKIMEGQKRIGDTAILRATTVFGSEQFWAPTLIFGDELMFKLNDEGISGGVFWKEVSH